MPVCASCGHENPEEARFCNGCGAALEAAPAPAREVRKTVTVLFCDVTGSTALGERLDPESLRRVMARYFEVARACLERHGGTVEKFIGDAVMAVFGIPVLHEDDALRALRAAAELRDGLSSLNTELERDFGVSLQARIGVNTGEVVAGTEERLATGDAVNVAARLEQAAQPGEILIGGQTHRLVRDAVELEEVEAIAAKGKADPVPAFRLLRVRGGDPVARRLDSPLVGRERELRRLRDAFAQAVQDRSCQLFTVLGPAGVGKSRLVLELLDSVEGDATVAVGRCLPYGEGITFWPLAEIVEQLGGDPAELLSAASPEETFWAARKLLEAVAVERPLVAVLDDIHWAEPTFLDLVEHVADWSRDAPILLVCLARPELLDARPAWGGGKLNATAILLEPLGGEEVARLIDNLAGDTGVAVRARIVEAAEGNPFFVEEMLAMLAEDGEADGQPEVPPTIQALLAARLDRLEPNERDVVGRASVEGKLFHLGAVSALGQDEPRPEVAGHLMALVRKELIRPDRPAFAGEDAFRFRHLLIRDAAYQSLPKEARAGLHERFAGWLERAAGERAAEYEGIVGYHLEQAYRYRLELGPPDERALALARRAAGLLAAVGQRARTRGDMPAAAGLLGRVAELLPAGDPARLSILPDLGDALMEAGELAAAEDVLVEAVAAAEAAGDRKLLVEARIVQLLVRISSDPEGRAQEARAEVERALPVLEELGDDRALARAWRLLGETHLMAAQYARLVDAAERAAAYAQRAGDRREEAEALVWVLVGVDLGPTPVAEAVEICARILAEAEGSASVEGNGLGHLAYLYARDGRLDEARRLRERGRAGLEEVGAKLQLAVTTMFDGWIEHVAGSPGAAENSLRRAYRTLEEMGEKSFLSTLSVVLAQVLYAQGAYDEAEELTHVSEEAAASDDVASQVMWRSVRGGVLARRGYLPEGEELARRAVQLAEQTDGLDMHGDALVMLGDVLSLAGRADEARTALEEAERVYERKGYRPEVNPARRALAGL